MVHVLEFIVALIIVFIIAVIVGVFLPSQAHIQRSLDISHNPQHIYDVLNNFRRFPDGAGAGLKAEDPGVKFTLSGPAYGPGATISWAGNKEMGDGRLVNKTGHIDIENKSSVTWDLTNNWYGDDKQFTITVDPKQGQRVSTVTWSYNVHYGWNLIARYSQFWIHGTPDAIIQAGLASLQNMLAGIANIDYAKVHPGLYEAQPEPVLVVSTKAQRTIDDIDTAKTAALNEIQAAMKKLGVEAAGPTTTIRKEWGDTTFVFELAVPINTTTLTVDGKSHDLTKLPPPPSAAETAAAAASSAAKAASAASAASAGKPASGSSSGSAASKGPAPGSLDKDNRLVVNDDVRAMMMPGGKVLAATWTGESGVEFMVKALQAYSATHGYKFDPSASPAYNQLASAPNVDDDDQIYYVFLPVTDAPAETPDQLDKSVQALQPLDPAIWKNSSTSGKKEAAKKGAEHKKPAARKRSAPAKKRHRG